MNIKQLEYFVDLSQTLNFTKTAQNFYISQTAITKQIQCLEKDLEIPLFIRSKKSVELTNEGNLYLPYARKILDNVALSYQIIEEYQIDKYQFNPIYTGYNIDFFKENVFLKKSDILSTSMSIKDFFIKQMINNNDFGKINIMPNGDVHSNINYPALGNICTHSIFELIQKEIEEGKSWLRVRNQEPCNACIYQWLCPSPSDYEIMIGQTNLCHVNIHNPNCENL